MNIYHRGVNGSHTRVPAFLVLLLVVLFLVACGGAEPEPMGPLPEEVVPAAVDPTDEPIEAEPPAPTEEIATAEPATALPEPTAAPTEEPTEEPQGVSLPEGQCANPYFPVVEGAVYTYQTDVPDLGPSTYTFRFSNLNDTSFEMILGDGDTDLVSYTWQCLEDGLLSPNIQLDTGGLEIDIETVEFSGLTLPVPGNIALGATWPTRYVTRVTIGDTGLGSMVTNQTTEMTNEIVAIESITTPLGTFEDAVKVESIGSINMVSMLGDQELPAMTIDMRSVSWYVENVGRVRTEDLSDLMGTGEMTPVVSELISIE